MRAMAAAASLWLALLSLPGMAQQRPAPPPVPSPITDHFYMRGGYYGPSLSTELRLDPQGGLQGTELSAENDLALDNKADQGRIEMMFRMRERNKLRVDYFKLDRFGDTTLDRSIVFGDQTFNVTDRVQTDFNWRMLGFTYSYSLLKRERMEMGLGLGLHLLEAQTRGEVRARNIEEEASGVGAFPTVAVDAAYRITRRFALTARGQYFSASINDFDGSLGDYHADVQFRWRPNLAFGLGYTAIRAKLVVTGQNNPGRFVLDSKGPEAFFRVSF
ncbi:MAG: hypothetical protein R3E77_03215 [Steroidobacteraceae bacterium]